MHRFPPAIPTTQKPPIEIRRSTPGDSHVNNNFNSSSFFRIGVKSHTRHNAFIRWHSNWQCDYKLWRFEHNLILRLEMFQRLFVSLKFNWHWPRCRSQCTSNCHRNVFFIVDNKTYFQQKVSLNCETTINPVTGDRTWLGLVFAGTEP